MQVQSGVWRTRAAKVSSNGYTFSGGVFAERAATLIQHGPVSFVNRGYHPYRQTTPVWFPAQNSRVCEVNPAYRGPAGTAFTVVVKLHRPFEYVGILSGVVGRGVGAGYANEVAKVLQKQAIIGAFGTASRFPAGFKFRISHG